MTVAGPRPSTSIETPIGLIAGTGFADAFGKAATPHVSIGSAIQFAASVHLAASFPNQSWMEYWYGANPIGNAILKTPFTIENGYFYVPDTPGLGIEVDEEKLLQFAI